MERQLSIARLALCMGSTAAARAALRVLSGEDFVDARAATAHLRTIRDRTAEDDDILTAIRCLCSLEPHSGVPQLAGTG